MNSRHFLSVAAIGALSVFSQAALAEGSVKITSPANGATLDAMGENRLVYDVAPGPRGDHVHVYLDDKEVGILRKLKGSYLLESLASGKHNICVKVVNKAHVPIGVGQCVNVTVN